MANKCKFKGWKELVSVQCGFWVEERSWACSKSSVKYGRQKGNKIVCGFTDRVLAVAD